MRYSVAIEGEDKFYNLYESIRDGIVSVSLDGHITDANQAYLDMLGYDLQEAERLTYQQLTPEKWHAMEQDIVDTQITVRGYSDEYEKEYIRKDGSVFPISIRTWLIKDDSGTPLGMWAIVRDITERKAYENEIEEARENWARTFDVTSDAMFLVDEDLNVLQYNKAFARLVGRDDEDLTGEKCHELVHNLAEAPDFCVTCAAIKEKKNITAELYEPHLDKYLDVAADPTFDAEGNFEYVLHTIRDVTERKRAQALSEEQFVTFKGVIDSIDYPIFSVDADYRYTSFNTAHAAAMRALYGKDIELGMSILDYQSVEKDRLDAKANIDRALKDERVVEEAYSGEEELSRLYFEALHNPIVDDQGSVVGVAISARDITERRRIEEDLVTSEAKYRSLFENMLEGFSYCRMIYDETGTPVDWIYLETNKMFDTLSGLHDVDGRRVTEVIPGIRETNSELFDIYGRVASTGEPTQFEVRLDQLSIDLAVKVFCPAKGFFVAVFENITERKAAEVALRESEERYRQIFVHATEGIFQSTPDGSLLSVNPAFARMYGYESPEQMTQEVTDIASQLYADLEERSKIAQLLSANGSVEGKEVKFRRRDGSTLWVRMNAHVVGNEDGEVVYYEGTTEDVTARREAEENLRITQFEVDNAEDMIMRVGRDGRVQEANEARCAAYGYTREEILSLHAWDLNPALSEDTWPETWEERKSTGRAQFEAEGLRKDGTTFPVEQTLSFMEFEGQEFIVIFGRDISERKEAEQELTLAEARYRELAESLPEVVFELDSNGLVTYVNQNALSVFGYTQGDIDDGLHALDIIEEVDQSRVAGAIDKMMDGSSQGAIREYAAKRKDGTTFPAMVFSALVIDTNRTPVGIRGILTDISERKAYEVALEASEKKYRELANSLPEVVFEVGRDGVFRYVNESGAARFGYSADELVGKLTPLSVLSVRDHAKGTGALKTVLETGQVPPEEYEVLRKDGSSFAAVIYMTRVMHDGEPSGASGIVMDISERKKYEDELQKANVELEGFAHTVSHDLRGPLTVIGFAGDLINQYMTEPLTDDAKAALSEATRLLLKNISRSNALIENLLTLAEAGQKPTGVSDVDVRETVETVLDENAGPLRKGGFRVKVGDDLGFVRANPTHIYQIFANLIRNSIKHCDCKKPVIEVSRLSAPGDVSQRFLVRDNGVGIPADKLQKIFIPFFKGRDGGTGIGLATVEKAVKLYGGWIRAYNDSGACFEFVLRDWQETPE